jgi:hypothetical protein
MEAGEQEESAIEMRRALGKASIKAVRGLSVRQQSSAGKNLESQVRNCVCFLHTSSPALIRV